MHKEVALRVNLQEKLYYQNETMFNYVHELIKAQKKNERTMKSHVLALQEALYASQQEKSALVDKIVTGQATKDAIKNLESQQERLEQEILETQNARRASVVAGQDQKVENQVRFHYFEYCL